ncbi:hypothetical protein QJ367_004435 [Vibrio vulnificus]|nr:hypothetical protein [Vibrio vulnificus]
MKTKAFQSFESKIHYFDDDIELMDVLRRNVMSGELTDPSSANVLKGIDESKHKHLARRRNSDGSRGLVIHHLRSTVYSAYVKDVYEEVTAYLKIILELAAQNGFEAGRLIGEHSFKINAKEVLEAGSWEYMANLISDSVFQSLEAEKSTLQLLKKIASKLGLDIDNQLIEKVLPFLEVRHFLVHTDGKVTQDFKEKYPKLAYKNDYIFINYTFVRKLRNAVVELISEYDKKVVANQLVAPEHMQP